MSSREKDLGTETITPVEWGELESGDIIELKWTQDDVKYHIEGPAMDDRDGFHVGGHEVTYARFVTAYREQKPTIETLMQAYETLKHEYEKKRRDLEGLERKYETVGENLKVSLVQNQELQRMLREANDEIERRNLVSAEDLDIPSPSNEGDEAPMEPFEDDEPLPGADEYNGVAYEQVVLANALIDITVQREWTTPLPPKVAHDIARLLLTDPRPTNFGEAYKVVKRGGGMSHIILGTPTAHDMATAALNILANLPKPDPQAEDALQMLREKLHGVKVVAVRPTNESGVRSLIAEVAPNIHRLSVNRIAEAISLAFGLPTFASTPKEGQ